MQIVYYNPNSATYAFTAGDTRQLQGMDGDAMPELEPQTQAFPTRDGEVYVGGFFGPRYLRVRWLLYEQTRAAILSARIEAMNALNPRDGLGSLHVLGDDGETYTIDGVLTALDGFDTHVGVGAIEALAAFRCPDPAWRVLPINSEPLSIADVGLTVPVGVPLSISSATDNAVLVNAGHVASYPVLTLTGAFTSPRVTNETTDQFVWLNGLSVTAGQELVIDMDRRTATLDGVNVMPYRSADSQAWALERGSNTVALEVATGSVDLTVEWFTKLIGI